MPRGVSWGMPTYQIEMLWKCAQCKHIGNPGLARHCSFCGHPKDSRCEEYFPEDISEANAIRDPKKLKLAKAGADWKCKYCDTLQTSLGPFCSNCGADRATGEKPWQAKVKSITQDTQTGEKHELEPWVEDINTRPTTPPAKEPPTEPPPPLKPKSRPSTPFRAPAPQIRYTSEDDDFRIPKATPPWGRIGIVGAIVALLVLFSWLIFRTKIVDAEVSDVSWEYKVLIDRYQVWHRDGWYTDPGAFDVRNEGPRIHHYDKVVSGSHQEPYSETYSCGQDCSTTPRTCTSNKNGSATCTGGDRVCTTRTCTRTAYRTVTDYRDEPRYQDWYSWSVWDWGYNRTVIEAAHDLEPRWPKPERLTAVLQPGEKERERRQELYKVTFSASDRKSYQIEPRSLSEFTSFPRGRRARLKVGIAHGVEVLPQ